MEQTLGKRIMTFRKNLGLTQDALAEQLGVTAQAVSKWEAVSGAPDPVTLGTIAVSGSVNFGEIQIRYI